MIKIPISLILFEQFNSEYYKLYSKYMSTETDLMHYINDVGYFFDYLRGCIIVTEDEYLIFKLKYSL